MSTFSAHALMQIIARDSDDPLLLFLELSHASWDSGGVRRVVANGEAMVSGGQVFQPVAFTAELPDDSDEGLPVLGLTLDNVPGELIADLRATPSEIDVTAFMAFASTPDLREFELAGEVRAIEYDEFRISTTVQVVPVLELPFQQFRMTPALMPGLF